MNAFKLIDESIRGLILIIFSFFRTTIILIFHPLHGAMKLYLLSKKPNEQHISSLTYLSLCMLMSVAAVNSVLNEGGAEDNIANNMYDGLKMLMGGGSSLAPLGGALAGTLILAAIPRLLAWIRGLRGRRRERFLVGSEYAFGATVLLMSIGFAILFGLFSFLERWNSPEWIMMIAVYPITLFIYFPSIILIVNFWSALFRNPTPIIKLELVFNRWASLRHLGLRAWLADAQAFQRRLLGLGPDDEIRSLRAQFRALRWFMVASTAVATPVVLAMAALIGGAFASLWIRDQETSESDRPLEFLAISCDLDTAQPLASAAVVNKTAKPIAGWLHTKDVDLILTRDGGLSDRYSIEWFPELSGNKITDVISPGQVLEISGPLRIPDFIQKRLRNGEFDECLIGQNVVGEFEEHVDAIISSAHP